MTKVPKCKECNHRRSNTCALMHYDDGKPYVIAPASAFADSCGNRLAIKTSPRWCPLRGVLFRLRKGSFYVKIHEGLILRIKEVQGEIFNYLGKECGIYRAEHTGCRRKYDYYVVTLETGISITHDGYGKKSEILQKLEDPEKIAELTRIFDSKVYQDAIENFKRMKGNENVENK